MEEKMFCFQCQETAGGTGCKVSGVCGKGPELAALQDLLVNESRSLASVVCSLENQGMDIPDDIPSMLSCNLFMTITNANFDAEAIKARVRETVERKLELIDRAESEAVFDKDALWDGEGEYVEKGKSVGVLSEPDENKRSLRELITYGLKGISAYMKHAEVLGKTDADTGEFLVRMLAQTLKTGTDENELIRSVLETGKYGVKVMALLDNANVSAYGDPEISKVNTGVGSNPGILVSGHDLKDLEMLLEQSKGSGVDIYTHSEMLPAHYYPYFKKYSHFIGNYGGAWWEQKKDFTSFNGAILMTTNCIVPPSDVYRDRLYTTGTAGYPGCKHIPGKAGEEKDFSEIIEHAKKLNPPTEIENGQITGGFAHSRITALTDKIVAAVKQGKIRKFVVMAGCDGRSSKREYYTDFAEKLPCDTVILTAGCAKYRYIKSELGDIDGIPRVLDAGQCNDSYSIALTALKLKEIFGVDDINDLPVIYNIAWYEQKAVIVLLSLLYLGVKNIRLGPTHPAFLSSGVGRMLKEKFGLKEITSAESDIESCFETV